MFVAVGNAVSLVVRPILVRIKVCVPRLASRESQPWHPGPLLNFSPPTTGWPTAVHAFAVAFDHQVIAHLPRCPSASSPSGSVSALN